MSAREFTVWAIALAAILPMAGVASGGDGAGEDPWATLRSCIRVVERVVVCQAHPSFEQVRASWCDRNAVPSLTEKQLRVKLVAWRKPDTRRLSCAAWTGKLGAAEQVGDRSVLGRQAARQAACEEFNRQLERATWLRATLTAEP